MRVQIKSDSAEMEKKLEALVKKQTMFAASVALTRTATEVRDNYVLPKYRRTFDSKNKPFEKIVNHVSASDARYAKKTGVAVAAIKRRDGPMVRGTLNLRKYYASKGKSGKGPSTTDFMKLHVSGGVKRPKGQKLAVPLSGSKVTRRKAGAKAGAVTKTFEPKNIIESGKGFILGKKGSGKSYIARRMARGGVQVLYSLQSSVKIAPVYDPTQVARRGAKARFPAQYRKAFFKALKTARLR